MPPRRALVATTVALTLVETAILSRLGPATGLALAPQVAAPPPYGAFHDLRWTAVYTPSWLALVGVLVGFVVARTAVTALIVRNAWPAAAARPPDRELVRRAFWSTVLVAALMVPWVVLVFASAVFSLSYPWIVAIPVVVLFSVVVHHAAITTHWWRIVPPAASVAAVLVAFATATGLGAVVAVGPAWARWPAAVVAGVVHAWCWTRIAAEVAPRAPEPGRPFAVVVLAGVMALVLGGAAAGFALAAAFERGRSPAARVGPGGTGPPVLVVKGFDSGWDGITRRWVEGDFRIERFSYAGLDRRGRPRPYTASETHRSVRVLARRLGAQVEEMARAIGQPVGIVAESQGALIARTYLLGTVAPPVHAIVALSPLLEPGRVSYPAPGRVGWGVAAGAALDGLGAVLAGLGPVDVRSDTPLFRSIVEQAPLFQGVTRCGVPGVHEVSVLPVDTGLAAPWPADAAGTVAVRPAFHGGLLGDDATGRVVTRTLQGRRVAPSAGWRAAGRVVQALASPWQVPSLAKSLEPAWRDLPDPDHCRGVRAALRRYLSQ